MKITRLEWQLVAPTPENKFFRVWYVIDHLYTHLVFIQHRDTIDVGLVDVIVSGLRAELDCVPLELKYNKKGKRL